MSNQTYRQLFLILLGTGVFATICVVPYAAKLMNVPLTMQLIMRSLVSGAMVLAIVVSLGLYFSTKVSLGAPLLEAALTGKRLSHNLKPILLVSIPSGLVIAVVIVALQVALSGGMVGANAGPPAWQGFLACFYGGVVEELECRLLVMSLVAWICASIRREKGSPSKSTFWAANVIAAIGFGAAHLPAASHMMALTPANLLAVMIPNTMCGLVFGYLFFTLGLEAAMIAHFSADVVLHVLPPLLFH